MKLHSVLSIAAACSLLSSPVISATLTINGTTDGSAGTLSYSPGSAFTAIAVFEDGFVDTSPSDDVGAFFDFSTLTNALQSFELSTELGTVRYEPPAVGTSNVLSVVNQIQTPDQQTVSVAGGAVGWSGNLGSLLPNGLTLTLSASGPDDYLFNDPNSLFSGAGTLSTVPDRFVGAITVTEFGLASLFDQTGFFFGIDDISIVSGSADPIDPISAVPVPASLPLLLAGFGAFGMLARRKEAVA